MFSVLVIFDLGDVWYVFLVVWTCRGLLFVLFVFCSGNLGNALRTSIHAQADFWYIFANRCTKLVGYTNYKELVVASRASNGGSFRPSVLAGCIFPCLRSWARHSGKSVELGKDMGRDT